MIEIVNDKLLIRKAIKTWGADQQKIIAIEEMGELIQEITHDMRIGRETTRKELSDEIGDVLFCMDILMEVYYCDELVEYRLKDKKEHLKRLICIQEEME